MGDSGHWVYLQEPAPAAFGFVYRIIERETGRYYIGAKQYTEKRGKRRVESNWREYISSSSWVQRLIKEKGAAGFKFEIIEECKDKASLRYQELVWQVKTNALYDPMSLNQYIGGRFLNRKAA